MVAHRVPHKSAQTSSSRQSFSKEPDQPGSRHRSGTAPRPSSASGDRVDLTKDWDPQVRRLSPGGGASRGVPSLRQTWWTARPTASCVQRFDDSRSSAIHTTYRISLRSSSLHEPRHPLLRVVLVTASAFASAVNFRVGLWLWLWKGKRRRPRTTALPETKTCSRGRFDRFNDPSAGSPTETLLRLLHPLGGRVQRIFRQRLECQRRSKRFTSTPNRSQRRAVCPKGRDVINAC